jgi:hypothetical protein
MFHLRTVTVARQPYRLETPETMTMHGSKSRGWLTALLALVAAAAFAPAAGANVAAKHHLQMEKKEQHITLLASETQTYTLSCDPGDIAADGMWRLDDIPQFNAQLADEDELPWQIWQAVSVRQSESTSLGTYTFTFRNNTSEDAQLKIFITCLGGKTAPDTHQHAWQTYTPIGMPVGGVPYPFPGVVPGPVVMNPADYDCLPGDIFIAPSWKITQGEAEIADSYPSATLESWTFKFEALSTPGSVTVSGRCLKRESALTGTHYHKLYAKRIASPVAVFDRGNDIWEHQISCGDEQKGLVGGFKNYGFDHWIGMDPRIKSRVYKTSGTTGLGTFYLVCFNDRTSRPLFP